MKVNTKFLDYFIAILENRFIDKGCGVWEDDFHHDPLINISIEYACAEEMLKEFKEIKENLKKQLTAFITFVIINNVKGVVKLIELRDDNDKLIIVAENEEELWKIIEKYIKEVLKFKSYYYRFWLTEDGWTWIDYGSHTRFLKYKNLN